MPQGEISSWPLRVAIIGGGIAGGLVAAGLEKYPNIDAHIYEASKDFWERGAGVGLSVNARRALDLISPEAGKTLERAGAVPMHPDARLYMGRGPEEGKMVFELAHEVTQLTVDRRTWVMRILECVPEERKHGGKKSKNIVEKGDEIEISFEDGTTVHADVVIGADGIHSAVRKYMFGADSELTKPVFRHCYHYFNIVPREDAMAKMDPKYFEQDCQLGFVGGGGFMMHDVNENGKMIQVAAMFPHEGEWPSEKWVLPADRHIVREELKEWGDHGRGVAEVCGPDFKAEAILGLTKVIAGITTESRTHEMESLDATRRANLRQRQHPHHGRCGPRLRAMDGQRRRTIH